MNGHYTIRPSFIVAHFQRNEEGFGRRMAINAEAELQCKRLNQQFGLTDDPESPFATSHHNVGGEYKALRYAITAKARQLYDSNLIELESADREANISIHEFLLLDNMSDRAKKTVIDAAKERGYADFIGLRASAELADLADEYKIGEVQQRVSRLIKHFDYAGRRCQIFFGLRVWNLSSSVAIQRFKSEYRDRLRFSFDEMHTAPKVRGRY